MSWASGLAQEPAAGRRFRELCHDMRQPVAGILSLAAAVLIEPGLTSTARARLEQIVSEAESLASFLEVSVHPAGSAAGARPTDLGQVAGEAAAREKLTYPGRLELIAPPDGVVASVSRIDARRIIANLLSNATRAAGPDGRVTLQVESHHGLALLVVEDDGPGFARIPRGTGLGSSVIAECMIRCGGRIEYGRSEADGVRATVSLPLAASEPGKPRCG